MLKKRIYYKLKNSILFIKLKNIFQFINRIIKNKYFYFFIGSKKPISKIYGIERGTPIDRYYIESFLYSNSNHIKGKCLEIADNEYTLKYGKENISQSDILDIDEKNFRANIYGDIRKLTEINDESYDCIILTQVLQFIDDSKSAILECHRILKKGGVLLATVPSLSRIDCVAGQTNDYWRYTLASCKYLFTQVFNGEKIEINTHGNCYIGSAFWIGMAIEDIDKSKLDYSDPNFPCLITLRCIK